MRKKELIVVGGPNGAGKSTFVRRFLAERSWLYLSADLIATELSFMKPSSLRLAAGEEFIKRTKSQLVADDDFIVETTLSGRTFKNYLQQARVHEFEITIYFLFLDSSTTCVSRVRERVRRGGHDVPEEDVRRRFSRSLANFWTTYRKIADHWAIVYNAGVDPIEVAFGYREDFSVTDEPLFFRYLALGKVEADG